MKVKQGKNINCKCFVCGNFFAVSRELIDQPTEGGVARTFHQKFLKNKKEVDIKLFVGCREGDICEACALGYIRVSINHHIRKAAGLIK